MKSRNYIFVLLTALLLLAAVGYFFAGHSAGNLPTNGDKVSLRLAWLPGPTFAGDYAAFYNGFWDKKNLAVEIRPGGFEYDAIKQVASGADTFGVTNGPQLLLARANGVPVVAIGAVIPRSPIGWVAKESSGIKHPQDFIGKKIGAEYGTYTEVTFEALCAKLGISLDSLTRVPVKFDPRPFVAGEIDVLPVYIIDQPIDLGAQGIKLNIIDPVDYGVSLAYGNVYFTTEKTIKERPDLVRAFLQGAQQGWIWARQHQDETVQLLLQAAPDANRTILTEKLKQTFVFIQNSEANYPGIYPMESTRWADTATLLSRFGELKGAVQVSEAYSNSFLTK